MPLPQGFRAAGIAAGIKSSGDKDLALIVNDGPDFHAAGVYTTNKVQAAPVKYSREAMTDARARAVVLNSGGANACTGAPGYADAETTAAHVAQALNIEAAEVQVCSTGIIGEPLPMDAVLPGVAQVAQQLSTDGLADAAEAILTTDTVSKTATAAGSGYTVTGVAKGAGMIAPGMATMLAVITTDAIAEASVLDAVLRRGVELSFNRADSDGCMSTNDTVILMASGASGVTATTEELQELVTEVSQKLARAIIADAEGAEHDIAVTVHNAATESDAEIAARAVTRSNLFKTAIYGKDPNWGRILSAVGTVDVDFDPDTIDVAVNGVTVCRNGGIGEDRSLVKFDSREVRVDIDFKTGDETATVWTNDLTHDYIRINAEYSS